MDYLWTFIAFGVLPFGNAFDWFPFYEKDQKL